MTLRLLFTVVVVVCFQSTTEAQHMPGNGVGSGLGLNMTDQMLQMDTRKFLYGTDGQKIDGTPYLDETFVVGEVYSKKGKFAGVELRYNLFADNIEFKQRDIVYALTPSPDIQKVNFGTHTFVVGQTELKGQKKTGYFALLDSGKITLVAKKRVTFRDAQAPKALEVTGKPAKYISESDDYFYRIGDGTLTEIASVKKFIESLPDKQEEMKEFASKEKISKNERELTKFIKYYNSL